MLLHQTQATRRFLSSLTKFDLTLTPRGTRNINFDLTVRMDWDQCHCEDCQIPFPTTIHGSKKELKQWRYSKNRAKHISMLLEPITFDPTIGFPIFLVFWKLDIQRFLETPRSVQSKFKKTFKHASKVEPEKARTTDVSRGGQWPLCGRWQWPLATQGPQEAKGSELGYKCFQTPHFVIKKKWVVF